MVDQTITPAAETKPEGVQPTVSGAQDGTKPAGEKPAAVVTPKTYTEEEFKQHVKTLKGGHEGTVQKMRGDIDALNAKLAEAQAAIQDKEYDNWLRVAQEQGGGVDAIKKAAELDKRIRAERTEFEKEKAAIVALKKELDEAGKNKFVFDTIKKYELPEETASELSALDDKWEITAKAAELALGRVKAAAVPPVKTDKADAKPAPKDWSKVPLNSRLGSLMEDSKK